MGFSAKLFEVVLYPESFDLSALPGILQGKESSVRHYAYILHDQDEGKKPHVHLALRMWDSWQSDNVAKWFQAGPNQMEKVKGRWSDMLSYLIHKNAPAKFQYAPELVVSNFDWQKEVREAKPRKGEDQRRTEIISGIESGEIRQFNYHDHIEIEEAIKYSKAIEIAFQYRLQKVKGVHRAMDCIFITGAPGVGKSTYAKQIAEKRGFSVYVSSSSNDPLDDYQGQDCIILDDFRGSVMKLSDLLKMLDNHTASTVKSRYRNKVLECRLMIITSTQDIDTFFKYVFADDVESILQLKRRCALYVQMNEKDIVVRRWLEEKGCYSGPNSLPNHVLKELRQTPMTHEEVLEDMARIMGYASEELKTLIDENRGNDALMQAVGKDLADTIKDAFGEHGVESVKTTKKKKK